ncbi:hypothetical protein BC829DRAFT_3299 [Chytridium lagenaria]|nr:hypothetical protein BC829DRAFT_3299 [Chytridium lagenaria]
MSLPGGPPASLSRPLFDLCWKTQHFAKTGVGVQLDNHKLNKFYGIEVKASLDSSVIARLVGVKSRSLAGLYYIYVNSLEPSFKISKSSRSFNWDSEKLDDRALRYAADDALASLKLFKSMFRLPSLKIAPWEKEVHPSFRGDALASLPPPFKSCNCHPLLQLQWTDQHKAR